MQKLRSQAEFYFDCGDAVKVGNVGIPLSPDPIWSKLHELDCTASVPGNREFHVSENGFRAKLKGLAHPMVCANLHWNGASRAPLFGDQASPLPKSIVIGDVGIFGLMVPMVTEKMAAKHISAFLNSSPQKTAEEMVAELRNKCKLIICLSHLGLKTDQELANKVSGIDFILGGHSHDLIEQPIQISKTRIFQSGSHARFAGLYKVKSENELWNIESAKLVPLR